MRAPKPIATDRLLVGYKAPGQDEADWAALEIVSTLLAGCPSARLHRRLVIEDEAASSVDAQLTPFRDPSLLRLAVTTARGHTADEILQTIDRELAALDREPADRGRGREGQGARRDRLLERRSSTSTARPRRSVTTRPRSATSASSSTIAERLTTVTAEDVARVVRAYLVPAQAHDRDRRAREDPTTTDDDGRRA